MSVRKRELLISLCWLLNGVALGWMTAGDVSWWTGLPCVLAVVILARLETNSWGKRFWSTIAPLLIIIALALIVGLLL